MVKQFTDQMNQTIFLSEVPKRIVSLVPSQTELLFDLGLEKEVVGITKFCIHPVKWHRSKKRIGGTKNIDIEKVKSLQPDLIIGNKEENDKENIEALRAVAPVWMSDIFTLEDAIDMIHKVGEIVDKPDKSTEIIHTIESNFNQFKNRFKHTFHDSKPTVLYLIWKNPYLAAGKNTFIDSILNRCGFKNFISENRYPEVNPTTEISPDYVFLSSEPYPFKDSHIQELKTIYPTSSIQLVDGELFSWYGSRLIHAPAYFEELINLSYKK